MSTTGKLCFSMILYVSKYFFLRGILSSISGLSNSKTVILIIDPCNIILCFFGVHAGVIGVHFECYDIEVGILKQRIYAAGLVVTNISIFGNQK